MISFEKKLKELIEKDSLFLNPQISLNDIANLMKTSPSVVSAVIESNFGKDYHTFINARRVQSAVDLLGRSNLKDLDFQDQETSQLIAAQIAKQCGFSSTKQLYKKFKKHQGEKWEVYLEKL